MTIRDVAKRAKVGIATVSRVLNGHPSVRPETRDRVLAAIQELNYSPNTAAQTLSSGLTNAIGVFVPFFTRPSFVQRLIGIQTILDAENYDLILFSVNSSETYHQRLRQAIQQRRVDGILVISMVVPEEHLLLMKQMNIPLVLIESYNDITSCVTVDNTLGGQLATEYLLSLGHEQIAFLGHQRENPFGFSAINERYIGYKYALSEANLDVPDSYHSFAPLESHGRKEAVKQALQLLCLPQPPTAIFATSDTQAAGVVEAAREMDIDIPNQLSIIGFDDLDIASYMDLTTVRQPMVESGKRGAALLIQHLQDDVLSHRKEVLELELIERGSTAPLAGG